MTKIRKVLILSIIFVSILGLATIRASTLSASEDGSTFEVFVDNQLIIHQDHIKGVQAVGKHRISNNYYVAYELTEEGGERFAVKTKGREGSHGVTYLNRPHDSVLVFKENLIDSLEENSGTFSNIRYDRRTHRIIFTLQGSIKTGETSFPLRVPSIKIESENGALISENYILPLGESGEISRAILLGKKEEFSNFIEDNRLVVEGNPILPVEYSPRRDGETSLDWVSRISGLKDWPILQSIAGENPSKGLNFYVESKEEAEEIRKTLLKLAGFEPGNIEATELDVYPKEPEVGENILIWVKGKNPENKPVVDNIEVKFGGRVKREEITLPPEDNDVFGYRFRVNEEGTFKVEVREFTETVKVGGLPLIEIGLGLGIIVSVSIALLVGKGNEKFMKNQYLIVLGLVGSLVVIIGVFLPWASVSESGVTHSSSGLDLATIENIYNITPERRNMYPHVVIAGGIIGLVGSIGAFGKIDKIENLLPVGGTIAILGAGWGLVDIIGLEWAVVDLGIYLCLTGGTLALLSALASRIKTSA